METIFTTFSYIVFLLLGYYLAKTKEEKKELHQSARKIFPQKKRKPLSKHDRELNALLKSYPKNMHKKITEEFYKDGNR